MNGETAVAPVLVFTCGNPSRGDDALGPAMFDLLQKKPPLGVDLLTDFQLQIEHALDFEQRKYILFIDAGITCEAPFELNKVEASRDESFTTHAMSPSSVLAVYQQIHRREPPPAFLLAIRAYEFGLGKDMSPAARNNLLKSYEYLMKQPPWQGAL